MDIYVGSPRTAAQVIIVVFAQSFNSSSYVADRQWHSFFREYTHQKGHFKSLTPILKCFKFELLSGCSSNAVFKPFYVHDDESYCLILDHLNIMNETLLYGSQRVAAYSTLGRHSDVQASSSIIINKATTTSQLTDRT